MHKHHILLAAIAIPTCLSAQRMLCLDSSRAVSEIDITTGVRTAVGTVSANAGTSAEFAYDPVSGRRRWSARC